MKAGVMRVLILTVLTMVAFAGNSVLNRVAIVDGGMDAFVFGAIRLLAGAAILAILVLWLVAQASMRELNMVDTMILLAP